MMTSIKRWLAPPVFDDEEKNRRAELLNATILIIQLYLILLIGGGLLGGKTPSSVSIMNMIVFMESAVQRADEIRQKCAETALRYDGQSLSVTMSFGVASYPAHGKEAEEIIIKADKALYKAKHSGRNRVIVWVEP